MRSLGICLVLTLQTKDQSSAVSPRSATSPNCGEDRSTSASSLPCGENLLASGGGNKTDWGTVHVVFTMSKLPVILSDFSLGMFRLGHLCRRSRVKVEQAVCVARL